MNTTTNTLAGELDRIIASAFPPLEDGETLESRWAEDMAGCIVECERLREEAECWRIYVLASLRLQGVLRAHSRYVSTPMSLSLENAVFQFEIVKGQADWMTSDILAIAPKGIEEQLAHAAFLVRSARKRRASR